MTVPGVSKNDSALAGRRNARRALDVDAARVLYAVAHLPRAFTEGDAADPATVVALQQRGIRRRARAGYLELTDDARLFSFAPEPPDPDRSALTFVAPPLSS